MLHERDRLAPLSADASHPHDRPLSHFLAHFVPRFRDYSDRDPIDEGMGSPLQAPDELDRPRLTPA